jgi:hypothetical protein
MGKICVIGPRSSGKTTYLAGLAYWPDSQRGGQRSSLFNIQSLTEEAKQLERKAEDIIRQGESLAPTDIEGGIDKAPLYQFQIKVNTLLSKININYLLKKNDGQSQDNEINLVIRDYPGEVFDELASGSSNQLHQDFIEESLMKDVEGCLILLTEWTRTSDLDYSRALEKFTELMDYNQRGNDLRLAVAMSKCERGELWSGRLDPELDIFGVHLPRTKQILRTKILPKNLRFYALSSFGVLGRHDPRPNRIDIAGKNGRHAVLRDPSRWRPYNMIAPLYWLSKGKNLGA